MSTSTLVRWSGLITILAGTLNILGALLHPVGEDLAAIINPVYGPAHLVSWASTILLLIGLVGLYFRQAGAMGRLGLAGFVLTFVGVAVVSGLIAVVSIAVPLIAAEAPALIEHVMTPPAFVLPFIFLGFGLGLILFGVATMRAGIFPRWAGLLLVIGALLQMVEGSPMDQTVMHVILTIGRVAVGLSLAWMGYALWSEKQEAAQAVSVS